MKLQEMAIEKKLAMDRCISLSPRFVEHFVEICLEDNSGTKHHHTQEMQSWYNQIKTLVFKHNKKPINVKQIYDWFICGMGTCLTACIKALESLGIKLEEDKIDDLAILYDEFANYLLDEDVSVKVALKKIGVL